MRTTIAFLAVALIAGFAYSPAMAADTNVFEFQFDPDNPGASDFTMFDAHLRGGRSPQTPAGYNDQNWGGSNSLQVWAEGGPRHGISVFEGWMDDLGGAPILHAEIEYLLRNNQGPEEERGMPAVVQVFPMVGDLIVGNGDGLVQPGTGWMTWDHRSAEITDDEAGGVCTTCIGWGADGSGREGPVPGEDYLLSPQVDTRIENPVIGNFYSIDITEIAQGWQNGDFPNAGIYLRGTPGDEKAGTVDTNLYFVGADTATSGFPNAINPTENRVMPVLRVTVIPEPATLGLLGLAGLLAMRRNRR